MHLYLLELPVINQFMVGQQLRVENLDQIGEHDIWIGAAAFIIVVATVRIDASVVVPDTALLEGRKIAIPFVGGQQFIQAIGIALVEPELGVLGPVKDGLKGERNAAGSSIVGPEKIGAGVGQIASKVALAAWHIPGALIDRIGKGGGPVRHIA